MSTVYSESLRIMEKAEEAIETAEYNISGGFSLAATNRAYYGCYSKAARYLPKEYMRKHIRVFGQNFLNYLSKRLFFLILLLIILRLHLI